MGMVWYGMSCCFYSDSDSSFRQRREERRGRREGNGRERGGEECGLDWTGLEWTGEWAVRISIYLYVCVVCENGEMVRW